MKNSEFVDQWPNIEKLIEVCGDNQAEAARKIGLSASGFSAMISRKKVKKSYELAAEAVLSQMSVKKDTDCMMVLKCRNLQSWP